MRSKRPLVLIRSLTAGGLALLLLLNGLLLAPAHAAEPDLIRRHPVLALLPVLQQGQAETNCSQAMYQTLMRQPDYDLLPDWYVLQRLESDPAR